MTLPHRGTISKTFLNLLAKQRGNVRVRLPFRDLTTSKRSTDPELTEKVVLRPTTDVKMGMTDEQGDEAAERCHQPSRVCGSPFQNDISNHGGGTPVASWQP